MTTDTSEMGIESLICASPQGGMIEFKNGDIFGEDVEALVNSVNCVGVMGRGIALQFKNLFPKNFKAYAAACKRGEVKPGRMFVHEQGAVGESTVRRQLPYEASLARQEPNRGHRRRTHRSRPCDQGTQHPVDCHSSARH